MDVRKKTEYQYMPFIVKELEDKVGGLSVALTDLRKDVDCVPPGAFIGQDTNGLGHILKSAELTELANAIDKIKRGVKLSEHEEYAIEVLWHEVLHNKSKNTAILPDIKSVNGFTRTVAETVNQLVARNTYPDFLKKLGGEAKHQEWVLKNGFGYKITVERLRVLIKTVGIDEKEFIKSANTILMKDYTNIDKKIEDLIVRMSGIKDLERTNKLRWAFGMLEHRDFDEFLKQIK